MSWGGDCKDGINFIDKALFLNYIGTYIGESGEYDSCNSFPIYNEENYIYIFTGNCKDLRKTENLLTYILKYNGDGTCDFYLEKDPNLENLSQLKKDLSFSVQTVIIFEIITILIIILGFIIYKFFQKKLKKSRN